MLVQVPSSPKDILVVDDAPENLRILCTALTDHGYSVRCAKSGTLAISGSQSTPPDLVLLDILMPHMNGYEVCQRLKQDRRTRHVPVIFLSALDDGSDKAKAFAAGGDDYIAKPFSIDEVLARVAYQLKVSQRQAQLQRQADQYRHSSHELRRAYIFLSEVLNSLEAGVAAFSPVRDEQGTVVDFRLQVANDALRRLLFNPTTALANGQEVVKTVETLRTLTAHYFDCDLFELCDQVLASHDPVRQELTLRQPEHQQWFEVFVTKLREGVVTSLRDISDTKSQILSLESMKRELYQLAMTDGLTRVGNRYHFDAYLEAEWQRSIREQQPLSLLLGDIDQFKRFNDACGHSVGDRCLQAVAATLKNVVKRPADLVARYGGEEFAIVLPNTPLSGAAQIANEVQQAIRTLYLSDIPDPDYTHVRLSIGVTSTLPQQHSHCQVLIEAADRALYRAKALGGDTSCIEPLDSEW
jgi:diguanylate cyclase (GGDEF)-like protein